MSKKSPEERAKAYADSGVNIHSGYALVQRIRETVKSTRTAGVLSDIGGFGGLFQPDLRGLERPVLVSSTDGVGTKLKLAIAWKRHDGVGIDLVAMSVNDVLVQGAAPLFFLDYFGCGKLEVEVAATVISGVAEGCRQAGCALLGGETAEMPGMYADGDYDLAGFCVGLADAGKLIDGSGISQGDALIGLASSGAHSNGYSLIRKILTQSGLDPLAPFPGLPGQNVRDTLLAPTQIYVSAVQKLFDTFHIKGMAHITGGGFFENIPRVLPPALLARIDFKAWPKSPLFKWLKSAGELSWPEMLQIFNCGIGFILVAPAAEVQDMLSALRRNGQEAWQIGEVALRRDTRSEQVEIVF
ncbi:MAG: phosphoribosylformylglycinamidine cyclo-ligase [Deltaproteobacteria bacterium]|jgi:phosphoribosylformylglycinamidine cyclo-ligase|nr:phosphoribosylformylglycinamidine cyclo-ligase [Deltaproteobacteria bacterium]